MALRHWLQLAMTSGLGPITIGRLISRIGTAEVICATSPQELQHVEGIGRGKASTIHRAIRNAGDEVDAELKRAADAGVRIVCREDDCYPQLIRSIPDPPAVLYVKGTLEPRDLHSLAIVGSRKCSYYGREQAERFGALLAGAGMAVISGGARGIDSAAHRGAMAAPIGRTIAVLGCGVDVVYPPENDKLFAQIAERGAVMSEYPMGTPPMAENFPRRNRIVSGMSRGVLVIEADIKSGALITARQALDDHNRPVFALPGRVDNPTSAGPHQLIRDGAILTSGLEDIIQGLQPLPADVVDTSMFEEFVKVPLVETREAPMSRAKATDDVTIGLSDAQRSILQHMGSDPTAIDWLIEKTELTAQSVLQELTFLSLKGLIKRIDGQTYVRARRG